MRRILRILLCAWSIGLGFRLSLVRLIAHPSDVYYVVNLFDALFDWMGLAILGVMCLGLEILEVWKGSTTR